MIWYKWIETGLRVNLLKTLRKSYLKIKTWKIKDPCGNLEKIRRHENSNCLYIGLYSNHEWVDRIIDSKLNAMNYARMEHYSNTYRAKITKRVREEVWNNENGRMIDGTCWCCLSDLNFSDFECGHIIPVVLGGLSVCKNLKPICRDCNQTCGTMNLAEFKKTIA